MEKKVFVSGCFDLLHSGHIKFLEEAAEYGDVYVGIGSTDTIKALKNRAPICSESERLYALKSLKFVKKAFVNRGFGILDFEEDLRELKPDYFFVNKDGDAEEKRLLCEQLDITYIVSNRTPEASLPPRSTTKIIEDSIIPYRLDIAGGWLDQQPINSMAEGPVIVVNVEPNIKFNNFSGMASSTRLSAIRLFGPNFDFRDFSRTEQERYAEVLFAYDNIPGAHTGYIAGSQDALGIVLPGINILKYSNNAWPCKIKEISDEDTLSWFEKHIALIELVPREQSYNVYAGMDVSITNIKNLAAASKMVVSAILNKDEKSLGHYVTEAFNAQLSIFPNMINDYIKNRIADYNNNNHILGYKLSGAGGGGYLVLVTDGTKIPGGISIKIRRTKN